MKGIEPPSPENIAGPPKYVVDARPTDSRSQGLIAGASQPPPAGCGAKVTRAPYGGSASRISLSRSVARAASAVGGRRSESLSDVRGRRTLPASSGAGSPAAPVTASAGRHVPFKSSSPGSPGGGRIPGTTGNRLQISLPSAAAAARAWSRRAGGISTWNSGGRISPVRSSSRRARSRRRMRKLDGTIPLAAPECTPSVSTSTVSTPPTMPRSEVVAQSCS